MSENKPSIRERVARGESMSEILAEQDEQQEDLEERRTNRPQRVDERVSLDEYDPDKRRRSPYKTGVPPGTSTVGESSRGEIPGGSRKK